MPGNKENYKRDCILFVISFPPRKAIKIAFICFPWKRISKVRGGLYESTHLTSLVEPSYKCRNKKSLMIKNPMSEGLLRCNSLGIHNNVNLFSTLSP